jgi:transcriptional regulator with XRE-family HTH domain
MDGLDSRNALPGSPAQSDGERRRRGDLREFLRTARERIDPATYHFEVDTRRRATGLRREEVAHLAGVSTGWYTLLETARNRRVSTRMLDRVARVLMLSDTEKLRLYTLAFPEMPALSDETEVRDPERIRSLRTFVTELRSMTMRETIGRHLVEFLARRFLGAYDFAFLLRSQTGAGYEWVRTTKKAQRYAGYAVVGEPAVAVEALLLYGFGNEPVSEPDVERINLACEIAACRLGFDTTTSTERVQLGSSESLTVGAMRFVTSGTREAVVKRSVPALQTASLRGDVLASRH